MGSNTASKTKAASHEGRLHFPFPEPPGPGEVQQVAPGLLWAQIPLPFQLDHVNVYLIEDIDGWAILDTGIDNDKARTAWEALLAGPLAGFKFTKVIATHYHPDHIGLAGWLCERFDVSLLTSQSSYLGCLNIALNPGALEAAFYQDFYKEHGLTAEMAKLISGRGHSYLRMISPLPLTFKRIVAGDTLTLGGRAFDVLSGDGHAPEQIMLYSDEDKLLLAADQVIATVSPNISVWAPDPDGDPLGLYLRSLAALERTLPEDTLVFPGHRLPFRRLHERCRELATHHEERCLRIAGACRTEARTVADIVPILFKGPLDPHQFTFAFSEAHAHVNHMVERGELTWCAKDGIRRVIAA